MKEKDSKNAFASSKLTGEDKYIKRHQDAIKIERAQDIDKRVADFEEKEHTLEWAKEAIAFCDREEENGKGLEEFSKGLQDLGRIRQEAKDILSAEDKRKEDEEEKQKLEFEKEQERLRLIEEENNLNLQQEQEKLKLLEEKQKLEIQQEQERLRLIEEEKNLALQQEQDRLKMIEEENKLAIQQEQEKLKLIEEEQKIKFQQEQDRLNLEKQQLEIENKRQEDKLVENLENKIEFLSKSDRNPLWLKTVQELNLEIKGIDEKVFSRVSNRYVVEYLNLEAENIKAANDLDEEILTLKKSKNRNVAWGKRILEIEKSSKKDISKFMNELETLNDLIFDAKRYAYSKEIEKIENVLISFEDKKDVEEFIFAFEYAEKSIEKLKSEIEFDEYIKDFKNRWRNLIVAVDIYRKKLKNQKEIDEQKAEKRKAKDAKIKAKEKDKAQKKVQKDKKKDIKRQKRIKRNRFIRKIVLILLELALIGATIAYGAMNLNAMLGKVTLVGGIALTIAYYNLKILIGLRDETAIFAYTFLPTILNVGLVALNIVTMVLADFNVFAIPLSVLYLALSIFHFAMLETDNSNVDFQDEFITIGVITIFVGIVLTFVSIGVTIA